MAGGRMDQGAGAEWTNLGPYGPEFILTHPPNPTHSPNSTITGEPKEPYLT